MPSNLRARVVALSDPANQPVKDQIEWLYAALSILDGKANGMLQINSLVMAVIAAFVGYVQSQPVGGIHPCVMRAGVGGCVVAFGLLTLSSLRCMIIVRMGWGFLTDLTPDRPLSDFTKEIEELCALTDRRTQNFYWAWWLSGIGFVLTSILALAGGVFALGGYR